MASDIQSFLKKQKKENIPDIRPGDTVKVYQKVPVLATRAKGKKKQAKEKIQAFEGTVIARKHGKEAGGTITVRKEISSIGVEKIFPIHSPNVQKIEILKSAKARRAKLYYLRSATGKRAKLKYKNIVPTTIKKKKQEDVIKKNASKEETKN